ncbi:MAG: enoyl-CoA hydratase/isomerase family protein [Actinobacteria bacterium]|nr:enoyl-CoA hydratase/isomerase family protein [Actinomycetota bacterium]
MHVDARDPQGRVRILTIDRPQRRNAVDHETLDELHHAVTHAPATTRVLVLRGAGGHFCAGADLTGVEGAGFADRLRDVLQALRGAPFPTLAAVDGAALGAGTQLAIACDIRTATPAASFGIPAAKLGLVVDHWTVARLVREAGPGTARSMLLAAEVLTGDDAHRLGLVQRTCAPDEALAWADDIATKAPLTISGHKQMLNALERDPVADPAVARAWAAAWGSADLQEGLAAFRERRPPRFEGR